MGEFLHSVYWVAIVLGVMILIHEFGHYAAAKFFGVRVDVFSIGFGTRLIGFRRGETDYRISVLPLGGYVKMAGENFMEQRTGDPREFLSHPRWHRFVIAFAGPAMNLLLAVAILTGVFMAHYEYPVLLENPVTVGWVAPDSPAAKAGLQAGDRLVRIENTQNPSWRDAELKIAMSPGQPLSLAVQRGTEFFNAKLVPITVGRDEIGEAGLVPAQRLEVTQIEPSMPAEKAGIKLGDEIVSINGTALYSVPDLSQHLQGLKGQTAEFQIRRNGQMLTLPIAAIEKEIEGDMAWRIGVQSNPIRVTQLPFATALVKSVEWNRRMSLFVFDLLQKLVQRKVSMKQMSGPIGIAKAAGEAARQPGWITLLMLTSTISLQLGLMNLLPIPILDGGIIMFLLLEGLIRRDISIQVKERLYQAAFVFLVLFAVIVIYNDIAKLIPGLG